MPTEFVTLPVGPLLPGWEIRWPLVLCIEAAEDQQYSASDAFNICSGIGCTMDEAVKDYIYSLPDCFGVAERWLAKKTESGRRGVSIVEAFCNHVVRTV